MADQKVDDRVEEKPDIKKTAEYRRFKKLLKQVIKSPPMRAAHVKRNPQTTEEPQEDYKTTG
jgi:hypothetical protein